jgi:trehalose 6-phosphate phosphatase
MRASVTGVGAPTLVPDLREWAILLDVDGTIIELAPTPLDVRVPPSLLDTLRGLKARSSGATALVSGRTLTDIDLVFAPLQLAAIGGHGAEFRSAAGAPARRNHAEPLDPALKRELEAITAAAPGLLFEDKGYSLALHYRLAPDKGPFVQAAVAAVCGRASQSLEVLDGTFVVEVKHLGFSKGTAIRELMKHPPFAGRRPIFVGDDITDQSAFAVMPQYHGLAISVRRRVNGVDFHFETPEEVRGWLEQMVMADEGAHA